MIAVPTYLSLSLSDPDSYEGSLVREFNLYSEDVDLIGTPFNEEVTGNNLLRRVIESTTKWDDFIESCQEGSAQDDLTCDLHFEKTWDYRRRFTTPCNQVTEDTRPCSGTYACLCEQSNGETYYRASKTMPVIPANDTYTGLITTGLHDAYLPKEEVVVEETEDDSSIDINLIITISGIVIGTIVLCCLCYCLISCLANRAHRITYLDEVEDKGGATMSKKKVSKSIMPVNQGP